MKNFFSVLVLFIIIGFLSSCANTLNAHFESLQNETAKLHHEYLEGRFQELSKESQADFNDNALRYLSHKKEFDALEQKVKQNKIKLEDTQADGGGLNVLQLQLQHQIAYQLAENKMKLIASSLPKKEEKKKENDGEEKKEEKTTSPKNESKSEEKKEEKSSEKSSNKKELEFE